MNNTIHINEHKLIARTQQGDSESFNPLVTKSQNHIYTLIRKQVQDPEIAKNLTQETFLKAFRAINTFRGDSAFYSWIYRIARNICIDFQRKQQAEQGIDPLHTIDERRSTDTHSDPGDILQKQELRQILRDAIAHLPPTRQRVFLLRYAEELPIKDIATRIKRSEGTVKTHLHKAHHQLRELLTPYRQNQHIPWLTS